MADSASNLSPIARVSGMRRILNLILFGGLIAATTASTSAADKRPQGSMIVWGVEIYGLDLSSGFTSVAAGGNHNVGLRGDGSIVAWGDNNYNNYSEVTIPNPNSGFVAVSAGYQNNLGLKSDGTIVCWGNCAWVYWPIGRYVAVGAGYYHSLGLKEDGTIVALGCGGHPGGDSHNFGQCDVPEPNSNFVGIAAGMHTSLGLKADGAIVEWGYWGTSEVNGNFVAISESGDHAMGLRSDGSVDSWGSCSGLPSPNSGFTAIAAGGSHCLALRQDGSIVAWGSNEYGQLDVPPPNADFVAISASDYHSVGVKRNGSIVAWGCSGKSNSACNGPSPNSGFVAVSSYEGLKADGSLLSSSGPTDAHYVAIDVGVGGELALRDEGTVDAFGCNVPSLDYGQCDVAAPTGSFFAMSIGMFHSLGIVAPIGSIVPWGCQGAYATYFSYVRQAPPSNSGFVAVSAGEEHSLGLRSNGSIEAWGSNSYGQIDVPAPNSDFVAISAGNYHSLGLKSDGSVIGWGRDWEGQTHFPPPNSGFVAISAGEYSSLALRDDGSIVGDPPPGPNTGFVAVSTAARFNSAIRLRPGDFDGDGRVDLSDYKDFNLRHAGPGLDPGLTRWRFLDLDDDHDVDLADFHIAQNHFTGP